MSPDRQASEHRADDRRTDDHQADDRRTDDHQAGDRRAGDHQARAAKLAWDEAPQTCAPGCRAYHRLWPTLRLLGLGAGPGRHRPFFVRELCRAVEPARGRSPRLLISGQADHAMAALVLDALALQGSASAATAGRPAEIVALDRCPTPLALVVDHAQAIGAADQVRTVVADARSDLGSGGFDAVTSHSFLSQLDAEQRPALLRRWAEALAPGGLVVTNTRLAPATGDGSAGKGFAGETFGADRTQALVHQVEQALSTVAPDLLPAPPDEIVAAVPAYTDAVRIHPVTTVDEVESLATQAGLVVDVLRAVQLPAAQIPPSQVPASQAPTGQLTGAASAPKGPGLAQDATYLELVAKKPLSVGHR